MTELTQSSTGNISIEVSPHMVLKSNLDRVGGLGAQSEMFSDGCVVGPMTDAFQQAQRFRRGLYEEDL